MKISREFSRFAKEYGSYNIIQNSVIKYLLSKIEHKPKKILDLGCGSGGVCKNITWEYESFLGIDFSRNMLLLHQVSPKIELLLADFNDESIFLELQKRDFDFIISASALQWARDLEMVFSNIEKLKKPFALAIFTSNTFKTLNEVAGITSILRDSEYIFTLSKKYFNATFEIKEYKLEFENTKEMFSYIKKSGVSASRNILSYKESKKLLYTYPISYLEFEVVFIHSML